MTSREPAMSEAHFSGLNTRLIVEHLRDKMPPGTLETVLEAAGETRSMDVLVDDTSWTSYSQMRRLFEATGAAMGGSRSLAPIGRDAGLLSESVPELLESVRALGSPAALYSAMAEGNDAGLVSIGTSMGWEIGPTEWMLTQQFSDGFEAIPEFCSLLAGLLAMPPRLFGYPAAEVIEEQCQADGAATCHFHIRWQETEDLSLRADHFETLARGLEMGLDALRRTVADIVSAESIDSVLTRLVATVGHTVLAPAHALVLHATPVAVRPIYSRGLDGNEAESLAAQLLADEMSADAGVLVVDVASTQRRYGKLAAIDRGGRTFYPNDRVTLEAYALLAASALDSAVALAAARSEAATAHALLELSTALAEIVTVEEVAIKLARAVPAVVDCDRSLVCLFDADGVKGTIAAIHGYPPEMESFLQALEFDVGDSGRAQIASFHERESADPVIAHFLTESGSAGAISVPIIANGVAVGRVVASVTDDADRLRRDPDLPSRLLALSGQAATAIGNARLLERIRHQALHDALTGLPNRVLILDRVESMLARARRHHFPTAALFIDLDGFKDVNDSLGHSAGDLLLQAVAVRLATVLRDSDSIGRLGGDEFVVLVEGSTLDAGPELVSERILDVLREPFALAGYLDTPITVTASIGIAAGDRDSAGELLRDADIALYRAKAAGKNRSVVFVPEMRDAVTDHMRLDMDLHGALERGEFFLVYQPIFELSGGRVTGAEALLRWRHPVRGVVQPEVFVPLLEESGRIVQVGRWVLTEACQQAARWQKHGHHMDIAVNFSVRQLETAEFVTDIRTALRETGIDPSSLTLEITETAIMRDADATAERLRAVKELGIRIAIDDFGTGYSSLAYLRQFPIDALKIDRSFIAAIGKSSEGSALTRMLVQLGKALGLETLAEGIEDASQYAQLQTEECDSGQGFLMAKPLDADALDAFLDVQAAGLAASAGTTSP
jgi:diguanylate cyclase (GGDEF)-like protein